MRPITNPQNWIVENDPCSEAVEWWKKHCRKKDPIRVLQQLIKEKRYPWANWFIARIMSYKQYVSYAVYAAKQVIDIYEKRYPDGKHPRQAIEAAKKCIDDPSEKNKARAARAAEAAWTAWTARTTEAAWTAWAARAAGAARAAARAAEAAWAAAGAAEAARAAMQQKLLKYGMKLLSEK